MVLLYMYILQAEHVKELSLTEEESAEDKFQRTIIKQAAWDKDVNKSLVVSFWYGIPKVATSYFRPNSFLSTMFVLSV